MIQAQLDRGDPLFAKRSLSEFLVLAYRETLLLALVPMPLVDLALAEPQALRDALDEVASPVRALQVLVFEHLELLLVLTLATLNVATIRARGVVLRLLKKRRHTLIQVVELKLVGVDIEGKVCL